MAVSEELQKVLPEYELHGELGRGAMGVVYLGRHRSLDRQVAIKELPRSFAVDPDVRERFLTEARVLAGLNHPHIVPVFDFVERDDHLLLVMQELPGGTLWDKFVTDGLVMPEACAVTMATCAGLDHAHHKGVLHRDVKPENLMFDEHGALKVTDFGIAKVVNGAVAMATVDGSVLGTPAYMAPEQASGDPVSATADVYAAGTMLFEFLSGRLPFSGGESPMAMLVQRVTEDPPPLRQFAPQVPEAVAEVVDKAIRKSPSERYSSAEEFGIAIGEGAATAWGVDWLDGTGQPVQGSPSISAAARTTRSVVAQASPSSAPEAPVVGPGGSNATIIPGTHPDSTTEPSASHTIVPGTADPSQTLLPGETTHPVEPRSDATIAPGLAPPPVDDPVPVPASQPDSTATEPAPASIVPPLVEAVRPEVTRHEPGADLNNVNPAEMVAVSDVLHPPRVPYLSGLVAMLCLAGAAIVGWTGLGGPETELAEPRSAVVVGVPVDPDGLAEIALDEPFTISGLGDGDFARVSFSALGVTHVRTDLGPIVDGMAEIEPGASRWVVSGATDATIEVLEDDIVTTSHEIEVLATNPAYTSATGIAAALIALFTFGSLESSLRPLRRGRRRASAFLALAVFGALAGALVVVAAALFAGTVAQIPTLIASAALGATGSVALGVALLQLARRRRINRRSTSTSR